MYIHIHTYIGTGTYWHTYTVTHKDRYTQAKTHKDMYTYIKTCTKVYRYDVHIHTHTYILGHRPQATNIGICIHITLRTNAQISRIQIYRYGIYWDILYPSLFIATSRTLARGQRLTALGLTSPCPAYL